MSQYWYFYADHFSDIELAGFYVLVFVFFFLIKVGIPLILTVNSANIQDGIPLSILQPMPAGEGVGS